MQKIKLTAEPFTIPPGFSLESYLRHSFGMFTEELVRVKVRFHKSLTRYLSNAAGIRARKTKNSKTAPWNLPLKWPESKR
jgi:hypothetical protein